MNPKNLPAVPDRLGFPDLVNPKQPVQLALLPAPVPAPFAFVEQPVQDVLRLARPVVTVWAETYL